MRIVADTNTVVSGLLWQGAPRQLVDAGRNQQVTLVTSVALLAELADVLTREKFAARIRKANLSARELVEDYATIAHLVEPAELQRVARDPDDDEVLACAVGAQADLIVSGDGDLVTLRNYNGIPIVTAREAVERIAAQT